MLYVYPHDGEQTLGILRSRLYRIWSRLCLESTHKIERGRIDNAERRSLLNTSRLLHRL